jgi:CorA-like Mg2+ transporter protein
VILVDPPLKNVWCIKNKSKQLRKPVRDSDPSGISLIYGTWCPPYSAFNILDKKVETWKNSELSPGMSSMFDDIISFYKTELYKAHDIPELCRRIILWSWTAQVHFYADRISRVVSGIIHGSSPWQDWIAERLVHVRLQMRWSEDSIRLNMNALMIGTGNSVAQEWEADDWRCLLDTIKGLERRIDIVHKSYAERASIREAQAANQLARSVGFLTSLATIFVPASFIAGIFAMVDDFSVGGSKFWVFWAVSGPVTLIILVVLFTRMRSSPKVSGEVDGEFVGEVTSPGTRHVPIGLP